MREYEFEVTIVAVVRVRAGNEDRAREVVASSALGSPSPEEIRQAIGFELASVTTRQSISGAGEPSPAPTIGPAPLGRE